MVATAVETIRRGKFAEDAARLRVLIAAEGVGGLIRIGIERGRSAKPGLKMGICGEHGGDPSSIEFCHEAGFDYVSCSPFRVPIARLAAAQAALRGSAEESAAGPAESSAPTRP